MASTLTQLTRQYTVLIQVGNTKLIDLPLLPVKTIRSMRVDLSGVRLREAPPPSVIVPADTYRGARLITAVRGASGATTAPAVLVAPTLTVSSGSADVSIIPSNAGADDVVYALDYWSSNLAPAFNPAAIAPGPLTFKYQLGSTHGRDQIYLEWNGTASQSLVLVVNVSWTDKSLAQLY